MAEPKPRKVTLVSSKGKWDILESVLNRTYVVKDWDRAIKKEQKELEEFLHRKGHLEDTIFESHTYSLRFFIDSDAPPEYLKRWTDLKKKCESGDNEDIVKLVKSYCSLQRNRCLPYLKKEEGGFGGDKPHNKQIRFRHIHKGLCGYQKDNDILLDDISDINEVKYLLEVPPMERMAIQYWTWEELDDILEAFVKAANYLVGTDCVNGRIEMVNKKLFRY